MYSTGYIYGQRRNRLLNVQYDNWCVNYFTVLEIYSHKTSK